ncbi:hypothetical protein GOP47_0027388 [Adiantum capillus-veneris]|nr:hypothetical protein GOP47_0027388 [Adiantum capillus-veneris]
MATVYYTLQDVSEHSSPQDCWLVIGGKVYDVTRFLEEHPGGDDVLLSATGKDATDDFEDVGHSNTAREMLESYYVGDIDSSSIPEKAIPPPSKQSAYSTDKSPPFLVKIMQLAVPLAISGLAISVWYYTKSTT